MSSLIDWIRSLALTLLAAGAIRLLLPEGENRKAVTLLLGLVLTLTLLTPLREGIDALRERIDAVSFSLPSVSAAERGQGTAQIYADRLGEEMARRHGLPFVGIGVECREEGGECVIASASLSLPPETPPLVAAHLCAEVTGILACGVTVCE